MRLWPLLALVLVLAGLVGWAVTTPRGTTSASPQEETVVALRASLGVEAERLRAAPATLAHDASALPAQSVLMVLGPAKPFGAQDRAAVERFVQAGGVLVVADDSGQANSLLGPFGLAFERVRLVEGALGWQWSMDGHPLELPSPTAILAGADATVLARSSDRSFLDRDASGVIDASDPVGPFPVAVRLGHGAGTILAVADREAFAGQALAVNGPWLREVLDDVQPDAALVLVADPVSGEDPIIDALAWSRTVSAGPLRPAMMVVAGIAMVGLVSEAWRPWQAHRARPLHFLRRQAAGEDRSKRRPGLTERGGLAIVAAPVLVVLWALTGAPEAAAAAGCLLAALGLASLSHVPSLTATRRLSAERTMEGTAVQVELEVSARRTVRVELRDELPLEATVGPGNAWGLAEIGRAPATFGYSLTPSLRGSYKIGPLRARRQDIIGLRSCEAEVTSGQDLMVTPRASPAGRTPLATRKPMQTLGTHRVNRAGDGTEFHALRPYLPGDPFRSVNWKASARSRDLMVNQRVHESMTSLTIFLDARAIAATGPSARTPFARSCRAALSVAIGATRMRDRLRVVIYGDGVQEMPPQPAARQIHELSDLLSRLAPAGTTGLAQAIDHVMPSLRPGLPVMVLSAFEADPSASEALASLPPRGIRPFVVAAPPMTTPVDPEDGAEEANAAAIQAEHRSTIAALRSAGIPVYALDSDASIDDIFQRGVAA